MRPDNSDSQQFQDSLESLHLDNANFWKAATSSQDTKIMMDELVENLNCTKASNRWNNVKNTNFNPDAQSVNQANLNEESASGSAKRPSNSDDINQNSKRRRTSKRKKTQEPSTTTLPSSASSVTTRENSPQIE